MCNIERRRGRFRQKGRLISPSYPFVTRRAREDAVDRIMAAFLEAHRSRPAARYPGYAGSRSRALASSRAAAPTVLAGPAAADSAEGSEQHGLLLGERLILSCGAVVALLVVVGYLWPHVG
jgi:hypothetical protein